jgi:hypothetical protein
MSHPPNHPSCWRWHVRLEYTTSAATVRPWTTCSVRRLGAASARASWPSCGDTVQWLPLGQARLEQDATHELRMRLEAGGVSRDGGSASTAALQQAPASLTSAVFIQAPFLDPAFPDVAELQQGRAGGGQPLRAPAVWLDVQAQAGGGALVAVRDAGKCCGVQLPSLAVCLAHRTNQPRDFVLKQMH